MTSTIAIAPVRKSLHVNVSSAHAFEVFTAGMTRWWPPSHSILKSPFKQAVVEPRVGGRWYNIGEDGSQCDNGVVLVWDPPSRLVLSWQINAQWEYDPALVTEVELRFVADGAGGTKVELEHRHIERMGQGAETAHAAIDGPNGWGGMLKQFAQAAEQAG